MPDSFTVGGVIATEPKNIVTEDGLKITSFRLASQQRRYDRAQGKWVDADTNWFTVTAFRQLAENAQASLSKGDRVIVRGRLRMRDWTSGERSGVTVEIEADAIGHDLVWGQSAYRKVARGAGHGGGTAPTRDQPVGIAALDPAESDLDPDDAELEPIGAVVTPF